MSVFSVNVQFFLCRTGCLDVWGQVAFSMRGAAGWGGMACVLRRNTSVFTYVFFLMFFLLTILIYMK